MPVIVEEDQVVVVKAEQQEGVGAEEGESGQVGVSEHVLVGASGGGRRLGDVVLSERDEEVFDCLVALAGGEQPTGRIVLLTDGTQAIVRK